MTKISELSIKENKYIIFFLLFLAILPIAHVTAVQNILFFLFAFIFLFYNYKIIDFKRLFQLKEILVLFSFLFILAFLSFFNSIVPLETLSELRSEFFKPFVYFAIVFFLVSVIDKQQTKTLIIFIGVFLILHAFINIVIWIDNGGWPVRTGGLLDGTILALNQHMAGERFGIWATYTLSFSIALMFTKYKKLAAILIFISLLSILANNTRATFVGLIFIIFSFYLFFYKNKFVKIISIILISFSILFFIYFSKNLEPRYNVYKMINSLEYFMVYSPSEFKKFEDKHGLGHSAISRLAMWKSVIKYRMKEPWIPQSYGRFLYSKSLKNIYKNNKQNIPYVVYSQAHSDFMSILFSLGFLGLICFIIFLLYILRINYIIYKKSDYYKFYGVFVFLGTIGYIASMMFGSFFGDSEQLYFYILLGISSAIYLNILRQNSENEQN